METERGTHQTTLGGQRLSHSGRAERRPRVLAENGSPRWEWRPDMAEGFGLISCGRGKA